MHVQVLLTCSLQILQESYSRNVFYKRPFGARSVEVVIICQVVVVKVCV